MDVHLKLTTDVNLIGSVSDFAYKWSLNAGLSRDEATRFTLAVDELVTDVVRFAYPSRAGAFEMSFHREAGHVEVVLEEQGEPFDPERHRYDRERAVREGDYEGAGFELIRHLSDDFVFINRGRGGKEFRIRKRISAAPDLRETLVSTVIEAQEDTLYVLAPVTEADAEDAAKLIYRTYGYTYVKEELYFPKKLAFALGADEKFGVIVRTPDGEPVGYFAIIRTPDATVGEVGEAVVVPGHRRRGVMTMMLHALIDQARARGLLGLFGEAVTVHTVSQRVNARFGFQSTALLLVNFPSSRYIDLVEAYPQDVSIVIDYLPLASVPRADVHLPPAYRSLLLDIYDSLGVPVSEGSVPETKAAATTQMDVTVNFVYNHAEVLLHTFGNDFQERIADEVEDLRRQKVLVVYVDLPLNDTAAPRAAETLQREGFVFSGLMPLLHHGEDYLRLQKPLVPVDFAHVHVYSPMGRRIKRAIQRELSCITNDPTAGSTYGSSATSTY